VSAQHAASQFRVRRTSDDAVVYDSGIVGALEEYVATGLVSETEYVGEIRYRDGDDNWSEWGVGDPFATLTGILHRGRWRMQGESEWQELFADLSDPAEYQWNDLPEGTIEVQVGGYKADEPQNVSWSEIRTFEVSITREMTAPVILTPQDGAVIPAGPVEITWTESEEL
jgi:hypothetical protein